MLQFQIEGGDNLFTLRIWDIYQRVRTLFTPILGISFSVYSCLASNANPIPLNSGQDKSLLMNE